MQVGRQARVVELNRKTAKDRSGFLKREGLIVRRLNQVWEQEFGAIWEIHFPGGDREFFSASELRQLDGDGTPEPSDIPGMVERWGDAPRTISYPFRKFAGGSSAAKAIFAFLVFCLAGILLVWAGLAIPNLALAAAGGALITIGLGAAAVLAR